MVIGSPPRACPNISCSIMFHFCWLKFEKTQPFLHSTLYKLCMREPVCAILEIMDSTKMKLTHFGNVAKTIAKSISRAPESPRELPSPRTLESSRKLRQIPRALDPMRILNESLRWLWKLRRHLRARESSRMCQFHFGGIHDFQNCADRLSHT